MPRRKRKVLKFDEDSVNKLLQEIYNDSFVIRGKITRIMSNWEEKVKDAGEIAALGDAIIKLISAEAKNQDQKIMLLKYLKEVVFDLKKLESKSPIKEEEDTTALSADRRNQLLDFVQEEMEKKSKK